MGADCKSVGESLRRFESYICHRETPEDTVPGGFAFFRVRATGFRDRGTASGADRFVRIT